MYFCIPLARTLCISFDANLVMYINSTNIPPIMIMNRVHENQNLLYIVPLMRHTIVVWINNIRPIAIGCFICVNTEHSVFRSSNVWRCDFMLGVPEVSTDCSPFIVRMKQSNTNSSRKLSILCFFMLGFSKYFEFLSVAFFGCNP